MIELFDVEDPHDPRLARGAAGLLRDFNLAGVLTAADVHVAERASALAGETDEEVRLALALAVRAVRHGSVCVDLADLLDPADLAAAPEVADLPWPEATGWAQRVAAGPLAAAGVVHVEGSLLYLDRYWREEGQVRDDLLARAGRAAPTVDDRTLRAAEVRVFPHDGFDEQRAAARTAAGRWTTVLTGGPGTGKTTAVAGLLAMLAEQAEATGSLPRVALTAPTGKAAARLQQAVAEASLTLDEEDRARLAPLALTASTLHRLLGWRPGSRTRFRHHRGNRLPHDVIVVDETSMVSLTLMARLVEAVRPEARLVLVGDPDQLASVEAGAVLADLVGGLAERDPGAVVALRTSHRFGAGIGRLAEAVRVGDADRVLALLAEGGEEVEWIDPGPTAAGAPPGAVAAQAPGPGTALLREVLLRHALDLREAAAAGDVETALAVLERHRLLCAHRQGPYGVQHWNRQVERWVAEATETPVGPGWGQEWYVGRPLLVTANDYGLHLFNGDTGVVVAGPEDPDGRTSQYQTAGRADRRGRGGPALRAVVAGVGDHLELSPSRLGDVDTMHAMTIHKSQGSQADEVTVLLPPEDSPLLSRELFYTAVTRARRRVRVVGTESAVRAAVERRARRATGLRQRLAGADTPAAEGPAVRTAGNPPATPTH
ncbi:exodeoxyribonuclease V subunit alpha [Nocardioides sp. Leaf307]|uniref:exodeoxyribonuclease V subunit alpha n=1 Tax=Nocardioides sp. Leaf307 TaxID=1736331 RepID=UPI0009E9E161|nr:exodeoxyribonuclease V subunit alpha [Nocardioides sp. Leaf307]